MRESILIILAFIIVVGSVVCSLAAQNQPTVKWKHLSTAKGDLPTPNAGTQQTASIVCDIDKDGVNDFVIAERTKAPSVVWYRWHGLPPLGVPKRTAREDTAKMAVPRWARYVVDDMRLRIEAGSDFFDIDGDGDLDIVFGGDSASSDVWWWENPYPKFDSKTPWKRHIIKDFGGRKHHDQIFGDFDGDGQAELVFWNQGAQKLYIAEIPGNPRQAKTWTCTEIYSWSKDSEMKQRQIRPYPGFKAVNEHEGLAKADIDGDGKIDIVGGGRWFKHNKGTSYTMNIIDAGYQFTRSAAGQLIKGGRPEVVLVVGDGWAPLMIYEWKKGTWVSKELIEEIDCGHSLAIIDFNGDENLDIWVAEMRLGGKNPDAKNMVLLGDGKGNFQILIICEGIELHESKIADLDGDGDLDILGKPYSWDTPRLDIWINESQ